MPCKTPKTSVSHQCLDLPCNGIFHCITAVYVLVSSMSRKSAVADFVDTVPRLAQNTFYSGIYMCQSEEEYIQQAYMEDLSCVEMWAQNPFIRCQE